MGSEKVILDLVVTDHEQQNRSVKMQEKILRIESWDYIF